MAQNFFKIFFLKSHTCKSSLLSILILPSSLILFLNEHVAILLTPSAPFPGRNRCHLFFCQAGSILSISNSLSKVSASGWRSCSHPGGHHARDAALFATGLLLCGSQRLGRSPIRGVQAAGLGYLCGGIQQPGTALWLFTQRKHGATSLWFSRRLFTCFLKISKIPAL